MHLIKEKCTGCGYCVLICPYDALKSDGWADLILDRCTDCNLCLYACPTDCFVPTKPPRTYRPRLESEYEFVVIGSGLGGLMTAAALVQAGHSVAVLEKLGFPGGRYTELDYKGVPVTTGAWTNLGPNSHIGRFLSDLGIQIPYRSLADVGLTEQYVVRFPEGRHYSSFFAMLSPAERKAWLKAIVQGRRKSTSLDTISAAEYLTRFSDNADLLAVVNATCATISGLNSACLPASEYIQVTLDSRAAGDQFAMPRGGVRTIIKALTRTLRRAGGQLALRTPVTKILVEAGRATGVELADGRRIQAQKIIHNGGVSRFMNLIGESFDWPADYKKRLTTLKGVECAALFGATREPLFADAPIMMTPNCRRVVGIFAPTVLDPALARGTDLHLFDAFFPIYSNNHRAELSLALADMRDLFPHFDDLLAWSVPMFFTGQWPGTESGQTFGQIGGQRLDPVTPIQNCFLVGMDVKGSGVAGDLIPLGVRRVLDYLGVRL